MVADSLDVAHNTIVFCGPRIHNNLLGWERSLKSAGSEVFFFTPSYSRDNTSARPLRHFELPVSLLSRAIVRICTIRGRGHLEDYQRKFAIIRPRAIREAIAKTRPVVLILRDLNVFSLQILLGAWRLRGKTKILLYTQKPLFESGPLSRYQTIRRWARAGLSEVLEKFGITEISPILSKNPGIPQGDQRTRPNCYFTPFVVDSIPLAASRRGPIRELELVSVGKFRPYKNSSDVIRALAQTIHTGGERARLTLIGQAASDAEWEHLRELEVLARNLGVDDAVTFVPNVTHQEMRAYLMGKDATVIASHTEPASIALLEGMAQGLVGISSRGNGTSSYIEDGTSGFTFEPGDIEALSEIFQFLARNPETRKKIGLEAARMIASKCSSQAYLGSFSQALIQH